MDIPAAFTKTDPRLYNAILVFVRQFYNLNTRWGHRFEESTMEIIDECVELQETVIEQLRPSRDEREPLTEENLLIASTLRLIALLHSIEDVAGYMLPMSNETFIKTMFLQPKVATEELGSDPSLEVSRCATPRADEGVDISLMLQDIVKIAQRLLLRGEPKDWPVVFCVLCLLRLIGDQFSTTVAYIDDVFVGRHELNGVIESLCGLYLLSTKECDPLVEDWDSKTYGELVGTESPLVECFDAMIELWIDEDFVAADYNNEMPTKIDRFMVGWGDY